MSNKALITGCNGFVGSHLADLLIREGFEIIGYDFDEEISDKSVKAGVGRHKNIIRVTGDLRDENKINEVIGQYSPGLIIHLAAQSSVKLSFEDPAETLAINISGTLNILEAISKLDTPPKTLLISSSEIYGQLKPEQVPVTEQSPMLPVNPYAVSKATVDLLAYQYRKAYGLPIYWARAFSHSGPGQKTAAVLSDWAFQAAKIELGLRVPEIKVGNMEVTRDYTDVRDTVKAYYAIVSKGEPGQPYNVCSGKGFRLADLLDTIISFGSKKINVVADPSRLRPVDIPILIGSAERLKADTGWGPQIPIEKTLRDLFDYWISYLTPQIS
ncbi:MAG: GDP-mannose 4,6-dehydratase [candidate division Zixibacteria bacterium]|nr:GDP-mannose 4,6-dehydratase [candidate division Zixibacteria bacterium]